MFTSSSSNMVMYLASANLLVLRRESPVMQGTISTVRAGSLTIGCILFALVAGAIPPIGVLKILVDAWPVSRDGSSAHHAFDVAPESAMLDGMVPLRTPWRSSFSDISAVG